MSTAPASSLVPPISTPMARRADMPSLYGGPDAERTRTRPGAVGGPAVPGLPWWRSISAAARRAPVHRLSRPPTRAARPTARRGGRCLTRPAGGAAAPAGAAPTHRPAVDLAPGTEVRGDRDRVVV